MSHTNSVKPGLTNLVRRAWHGFKEQHAAFSFACLYLVFEFNRLQAVYPAIDVIPWAQTLVVGGILLALRDPQARRPPAGAILMLSAFSVCVVASTVFSFDPTTSVSKWGEFFTWIVIVGFLGSVVSTRDRLMLFLVVYYVANLKMAQHGFRTWATRGFGFASWGVTGSPGWFQNSGEFGMQMAMVLPLAIAHVWAARQRYGRWVVFVGLVFIMLVVGSIIASNSRGAILGLGAVGIWTLGFSKRRFRALLGISVATMLVLLLIPDDFKARFVTAGSDQTSVSRLIYWQYGIDALRENPVLGVGFESWVPYMAARHPEVRSAVGRAEVIHNTFLEAATELGLMGFSAMLALMAFIFVVNRTSAKLAELKRDLWLAATARGLNGSLLVFLPTAFFMSVLYYPYLWLLLAMSAICSVIIRDPQPGSAVGVSGV